MKPRMPPQTDKSEGSKQPTNIDILDVSLINDENTWLLRVFWFGSIVVFFLAWTQLPKNIEGGPVLSPNARLARPYIRPSNAELTALKRKWRTALTSFKDESFGTGMNKTLYMGALHRSTAHAMPRIFHHATFYALSAMNPGGQNKSFEYNEKAHRELRDSFKYLHVHPHRIYDCLFQHEKSNWRERGYILRYNYLNIVYDAEISLRYQAKRFGQVHLMKWSPHKWGDESQTTVIQEIIPTSTDVLTLAGKDPIYRLNPPTHRPE